MTAPAIETTRSTRWLATLALVVTGSVSALLLWSRRDYVPMFDGRFYAECIQGVAADPGYIAGYRCAGHIAEGSVAILVLAVRLVPDTAVALLLANALLLVVGAAALWSLARSAFPGEEHRVGRALVVGAFLVHPIVLAAVVQPGLDLGLLVFSLCALAAAVEGRRWTLVLFGVLLIFSKEPGVLLYGAIAGVWLWRRCSSMLSPDDATRVGIAALLMLGLLALIGHETPSALFFLGGAGVAALRPRRPRSPRPSLEGLARAVLQEWPLIVPVALLLGYLLYYSLRPSALNDGNAVMWGGGRGAIGMLLRGGLFDLSTRISLALMFVIGFLWVPSVWMLVDLAVGAVRHVRDQPARPLPGIDRSALAFIIVVLLADVWLLSRYATYSNARYYLAVLPLALIAAYAALVRLRVPALGRAALLMAVTLLLAVSTVRTLDPVSRKIWGTFPFGDRSILSINSLLDECCGRARDQMAYNLEFTELASLQDMLFARVEPSDSTVLVLQRDADWYTVGALDGVTHRRTLRSTGVVQPRVLTVREADTLRVARAWYIEMPFSDDTNAIALIARRFELGEPCTVRHGAYRLSAREMRLRPTAAAGPSTMTSEASDSAGTSPCASTGR